MIINPTYNVLQEFSENFYSAKPFPHIVLDNFLEANFFNQIEVENSKKNVRTTGRSFETHLENKKWISLNSGLPFHTTKLVEFLNNSSWISNLRELTGIDSLIGTEFGNSKLGNYHEMEPEGLLAPHVDHGSEPETGRPHILNVIIYLSNKWQDDYGGATFFYDSKGRKIISKIRYRPNRAVVFLHTPYSFHAVEPIKRGLPSIRKSLYVDYYSNSLKPYQNLDLPFAKIWFDHPTTFRLNSILDYLNPKNINYIKGNIKYQYNKLTAN